jgi:hypothetical protein
MTYEDACKKAREESGEHECVQHVQAHLVRREDGKGFEVGGYSVSDWQCGGTVTSFYCGREQ